jgi:hypothetical protein
MFEHFAIMNEFLNAWNFFAGRAHVACCDDGFRRYTPRATTVRAAITTRQFAKTWFAFVSHVKSLQVRVTLLNPL